MSKSDTKNERTFSHAAATLWASACVIMAIIIMQAGSTLGPGGSGVAHAETVSNIGDYTLITVPIGNGEEVLVVTDSRDENIYTYVTSARSVELQDVRSIREMFELAQNRGNPRR